MDPFVTTTAFAKLQCGDPTILEFMLEFLEEDPRFFRSGYLKEKRLFNCSRGIMNACLPPLFGKIQQS
jgi:hypothetical protein